MKLKRAVRPLRASAFRIWRSLTVVVPGGRVDAFGGGVEQISAIFVINLDRQPRRWSRVTRELNRFRTSEGDSLTSIVRRLVAVDARDGRSVAATADVDVMYRIGDQLYVQPDARLAECFGEDEPVRMTRQEVAVARSHIEAWKAIATGDDEYVLVLEDDVWLRPGAAVAIDRAWRAACDSCVGQEGPKLLYLSYSDAGGTAEREAVDDALFRAIRGLWFLSGYVLSRGGAAALLRAMPVVGPVDLWMNYRFAELDALAATSPAIAQRPDEGSENVYSVLPYLARAGIVDAGVGVRPPQRPRTGPILAWTRRGERETLAMALSMLGLRVRAFDGDEEPMGQHDLDHVLETFDALVDPPLLPAVLTAAATDNRSVFFFETGVPMPPGLGIDKEQLRSFRFGTLDLDDADADAWEVLCGRLGLAHPAEAFPAGVPRTLRLFRDDRSADIRDAPRTQPANLFDDSPWIVPPSSGWRPSKYGSGTSQRTRRLVARARMTEPSKTFRPLTETFPGNLSSFARQRVQYTDEGAHLVLDASNTAGRPYLSGAFASAGLFSHGRFQAEIRPASGSGLVTGFFLHRDRPRQEIDIEFAGNDPGRMIVNVYFNPGDDGTAMDFGYRGSPWQIDLGFDATADFHVYAIDWQPDRVAWLVDEVVVHERASWGPTPIPHLRMRVHANLWTPRSAELAGRVDRGVLPAAASFRHIQVAEYLPSLLVDGSGAVGA